MGGVRVSARQSPRLVPFGQILIGGTRLSSTVRGSSPSLPVPISVSESQTEPILQLGGGVQLRVSDGLAVRVGLDHMRVFTDGESGTGFRFATGLSFRF
jgi:opacity protein-like surface antigen